MQQHTAKRIAQVPTTARSVVHIAWDYGIIGSVWGGALRVGQKTIKTVCGKTVQVTQASTPELANCEACATEYNNTIEDLREAYSAFSS